MDKIQKWVLIGAIFFLALSLVLFALSNRHMTKPDGQRPAMPHADKEGFVDKLPAIDFEEPTKR